MHQPIDPALRLQPGQQELTPAQVAEAKRFAAERIRAQLSTDPIDEREAEALLAQAYAAAELPPPRRIHWVDGPLELMTALVTPSVKPGAAERKHSEIHLRVTNATRETDPVRAGRTSLMSSEEHLWRSAWWSMETNMQHSVGTAASSAVVDSTPYSVRLSLGEGWGSRAMNSVEAYVNADYFACYRFFDAYFAPNKLHALAYFNELVSGYWLGSEEAAIVRRPRMLVRNAQGQLHSATGKCMEYHDGWGFYAWHGQWVPEKVILAPESLSRDDFVSTRNPAVHGVILERMGEWLVSERLASELSGRVIDVGSRGTLYAVPLSDPNLAPEGIVTYLQVEDATTARPHFQRVPSTMETADEAVAWLETADDE